MNSVKGLNHSPFFPPKQGIFLLKEEATLRKNLSEEITSNPRLKAAKEQTVTIFSFVTFPYTIKLEING